MKEKWLNIYDYGTAYVFGTDLYPSPKQATRDLADKEHYLHTINVETGEIKVMGIAPKTNKHYVEEDYEYEFGNGVMDMLH